MNLSVQVPFSFTRIDSFGKLWSGLLVIYCFLSLFKNIRIVSLKQAALYYTFQLRIVNRKEEILTIIVMILLLLIPNSRTCSELEK